MSTDSVRYALVGCGAMAATHAEAAAADERSDVVAFVDADPVRAEQFAARYGGRATTSYDQVLDDADVEAVILTLPHDLHAPFAVQAAEANKHAMVEKPMAVTLQEADDMMSAAERNGVLLFVAHVLRFNPANRRVKQLIESGELGEAFFARYHSEHRVELAGDRAHLNDPKRGGGVLLSGEVHHTDLMRWWMGDVRRIGGMQLNVRAEYHALDSEEFSLVLYEFENGALGESSYSYASFHTPQTPDAKATVHLSHGRLTVLYDGTVVIEKDQERTVEPTNPRAAAAAEVPHFSRCILNGEPLLVTAQDARRALELVLAAKCSWQQRAMIDVSVESSAQSC